MHGFQLGIILGFALQVHLPKHVESGFFARISNSRSPFCLQRADDLPTLFTSFQPINFAILNNINKDLAPQY